MKRVFLILLIIVLVAIIGFCAYQVISGMRDYQELDSYYDSFGQAFLAENPDMDQTASTLIKDSDIEDSVLPGVSETESTDLPIYVDFDYLTSLYPDIVGWIYSADGEISLPVAQGPDNQYYLKKLPNGEYSFGGTPFLDYINSRDFSDRISFIYGHNMKNGSMFEPILSYQKQSYYDSNPYLYLLTPDGNYKMEVFSGFLTKAGSEIYKFDFETDQKYKDYISDIVSRSDFIPDFIPDEKDRILCLSTCAYDYDNARYVVFSRLTPIG